MKPKLWIFLPLLVLIVLSVGLRVKMIRERPIVGRSLNDDATAHVLAHCLSYHEYPFSVHRGLPIANLRGEQPNANGEYLTDDAGHTFYCSFPPLSYLAVNTVFQVSGVEPSLVGLRTINVVLQILSCAAFGYLVWSFAPPATNSQTKGLVTAASCCLFFFCTETLRSYTFSHWAQHWHLPLLLLVIAQFIRQRFNAVYYSCLMLGCFVEWSAFVLGIGCMVMLLWQYLVTRERRFLVQLLLTSGALTISGLLLIAWYGQLMPVSEYLAALRSRGSSRSIWSFPLLHMIPVIYLSAVVSTVIPVAAIVGAKLWELYQGRISTEPKEERGSLRDWLLGAQGTTVVLFCFALLENVLILQHVMEYTYDRLKFVGLYCAITAMILYSLKSDRVRRILAGLIYAVSLAALLYYVWLWDWSKDYQSAEFQRYNRIAHAIRDTCPRDVKPFMANFHKNSIAFLAHRFVERIDETASMPSLKRDDPHPFTIKDRPDLLRELTERYGGREYRAFRYYYLDQAGQPQFEEFPLPNTKPNSPG
jgi:hypothetical protein